MSFLLESVEGGAVRGRYSIIGLDPDLIWRTVARPRRDQPRRARIRRTVSAPCNEAPLEALRALIAESRIELPEALPPMAAGIFGYLGYDMVRLMEELPRAQSRPDRHSRRRHGAPHHRGRVRRREGHASPSSPRCVRKPASPPRSRSRARASGCRRSSMRSTAPLDHVAAHDQGRALDGLPSLQHHARRIRADGAGRQGIHRRRRHLPGRAVAALSRAVRAAAVLALPRAAAGQSLALPLFPRLRRFRRRRIEPGNPGQGCAKAPSPSARSPARARAAPPRTRTRRWKPNCSPTRRSAPSI